MIKILINTISREDIINKAEIAEGLQPNDKGETKEGTEDEKAFAASLSCPEIMGRVFPLEQWIHIDEKDIDPDVLAKYPDIKEAHVVLEERMKRAIEEQGLQNMALGIKQAAETYVQELPAIADTVLKIAPVEVGK